MGEASADHPPYGGVDGAGEHKPFAAELVGTEYATPKQKNWRTQGRDAANMKQ